MRWRRKRREQDLDREVRSHLDLEAEDQQESGLSPREARYAARRVFGNTTFVKEVTREMWGWTSLERLAQDARYGARMLRKYWGFTLAALLTLALGIGANTAVFSIVNAVLIEPLPYPHADRLMFLSARNPAGAAISLSYPDFLDWKVQTRVFESLAAYQAFGFTLAASGETERLPGRTVSAEFFSTLGVVPSLGRDFRAEDARPGSDPVVILTDQVWRRRFQGDPHIINRSINLESRSFTVVGVLPPAFQFYLSGDVFAPIGLGLRTGTRGQRKGIYAIGRLRPGATTRQAGAEADIIARRLAQQYPDTNRGMGGFVEPLAENFAGKTKPVLLMLSGAVMFLLLISCANVANLLLARSASRQKEFAVRIALGAGRLRLLRQMLTENVLLAVSGGACGVLVANWSLRGLNTLLPESIYRLKPATVNGWVLGFALLASVVTGLLFGFAPAWQATRLDGARGSRSAGRRSLLNILVTSEVALSLVLLIGAGLMIRTLASLQRVSPGFRATNVLYSQIVLPPAQYNSDRQVNFFAQLVDRTRSLPGVQSASAVMCLPLSGGCWSNPVEIDGRPAAPGQDQSEVTFNAVAPDYFSTMGIPLLQGRDFERRDSADALAVAIISQAFAQRYFSGRNPIGNRVRERSGKTRASWATVVGVAGDVRRHGLDTPAAAEVYLPFTQNPVNFMTLVVHSAGNTAPLGPMIRKQMHALDSAVPLQDIGAMEQLQVKGVATRRLPELLLSLFAALALVLAVTGIYGVIAYAVSQRTSEIGIRMALGAERMEVVRLVVGQGMMPVCTGLVAGLGAACGLTRTLAGVLYGVKPIDPLTFACVPLLLLAIALLASIVPAMRAARVDPLVALRCE
jgi:predicted permease